MNKKLVAVATLGSQKVFLIGRSGPNARAECNLAMDIANWVFRAARKETDAEAIRRLHFPLPTVLAEIDRLSCMDPDDPAGNYLDRILQAAGQANRAGQVIPRRPEPRISRFKHRPGLKHSRDVFAHMKALEAAVNAALTSGMKDIEARLARLEKLYGV